MSIYRCHIEPDILTFETDVLESDGSRIRVAESWMHPGGGGQPADRATLESSYGTSAVAGVHIIGDCTWFELESPIPRGERIRVTIDGAHRRLVAQLHTDTHILNALVFREFDGALVTGAKISSDGTAHMDFDLPEIDNDRLRALEQPINDAIAAGLTVTTGYVSIEEAARIPGLVRNLAVAPPPTPDGRFRVIEIEALDRQACGGTHLTTTSDSPPIAITKVDNKGRRNRRVKIALDA